MFEKSAICRVLEKRECEHPPIHRSGVTPYVYFRAGRPLLDRNPPSLDLIPISISDSRSRQLIKLHVSANPTFYILIRAVGSDSKIDQHCYNSRWPGAIAEESGATQLHPIFSFRR